MKGVPLLPIKTKNKFACLEIEEVEETKQVIPKVTPMQNSKKVPRQRKWEYRLPQVYMTAVSPSPDSLRVLIQIQTMDTGEIYGMNGLVDSGANGEFLNMGFVKKHWIMTQKLTCPVPVNNVDGSPNEYGPISEVVELILDYQGHRERVLFAVTQLGEEDMILGLPWLWEHNPEVNWMTGEIKMSQCPEKCKKCKMEEKEEERGIAEVRKKIQWCRAGPFLKVSVEEEEEEEEPEIPVPWEIQEGDQIFMMIVYPETSQIRATGKFSQKLAEASHQKDEVKSFREAVPDYLHDFED